MAVCKNLSGCSFVNCCEQYSKSQSVNGFINMYCKGNRMGDCVRLKICDQLGKVLVPKNMMPNGLPLPGTGKDEWADEAVNYRKHIK